MTTQVSNFVSHSFSGANTEIKYYSHGYGNLNQLAFWMMNSFLSVLPSSSSENPSETVIIAQMAHMTTIVNNTGKSLKICKRTLWNSPFLQLCHLYAKKGTDTFLKYCENKVMKIMVPIATPQFLAAWLAATSNNAKVKVI